MRPDQAIAQFRLIDSEMQLQQATKGSLSKSTNLTKRTHTKLALSFGFGSGQYQSPDYMTDSIDSYQELVNSPTKKSKQKNSIEKLPDIN